MKEELQHLLRSASGRDGLSLVHRLALKRQELDGAGTTRLLGHRLAYTSRSAFIEMYREIFERECYYFSFDGDEPEILDIGANIGLATLYFGLRFPRARILAVEPNPHLFEVMRANLRSFGFERVETLQKAVGARAGLTPLACDTGLGSRLVTDAKAGMSGSISVVDVVTMNTLVNQHFDLIKMDIEGFEVDAILADQKWLSNCDRLFFEHHQSESEPDSLPAILTALKRHGFEYLIAPATRKLRGFSGVPAYMPFSRQQNVWAWKPEINRDMRPQ